MHRQRLGFLPRRGWQFHTGLPVFRQLLSQLPVALLRGAGQCKRAGPGLDRLVTYAAAARVGFILEATQVDLEGVLVLRRRLVLVDRRRGAAFLPRLLRLRRGPAEG